jgi:hypothetical protein
MKQSDIAAVIERDLLRQEARPSINIVPCFSCGYRMIYRGRRGDLNGNFCSMRCQDWFDAGNPPYEQQEEWARKPSAMSIVCKGCHKEFYSKGLRCCSTECERRYRERQDNLVIMAEVGIELAAKRHCANPECGQVIPKWRRNGRRVSSAMRFCSRKCARRAKTAEMLEMDSKR